MISSDTEDSLHRETSLGEDEAENPQLRGRSATCCAPVKSLLFLWGLGEIRIGPPERLFPARAYPLERRRATRYQLRLPVAFSWEIAGGFSRGEGLTRDVSEVGVYIFAAMCPKLRTRVQLEIFLFEPPGKSMALRGGMQVLRVEEESQQFGGRGFALAGKALALNFGPE